MSHRRRTFMLAAPLLATLLAACGGGSPLDIPDEVANPPATGTRKLSFAYFQRCVQPILEAQLPITLNGVTTVNSCASSGCHDDTNGTGGALRLQAGAALVDLGLTPEQIRATEMYRNFYSSQGEVVLSDALASRLIAKPLVRGVLHGGGLIFEREDDPLVRILRYWIEHPMPAGQDEFSTAGNALFTPPDAATGECNVE
jgi:predicted small lipoprotein YifL